MRCHLLANSGEAIHPYREGRGLQRRDDRADGQAYILIRSSASGAEKINCTALSIGHTSHIGRQRAAVCSAITAVGGIGHISIKLPPADKIRLRRPFGDGRKAPDRAWIEGGAIPLFNLPVVSRVVSKSKSGLCRVSNLGRRRASRTF